jgi:hypothetical protein
MKKYYVQWTDENGNQGFVKFPERDDHFWCIDSDKAFDLKDVLQYTDHDREYEVVKR